MEKLLSVLGIVLELARAMPLPFSPLPFSSHEGDQRVKEAPRDTMPFVSELPNVTHNLVERFVNPTNSIVTVKCLVLVPYLTKSQTTNTLVAEFARSVQKTSFLNYLQ
jgi:hypothetical protein